MDLPGPIAEVEVTEDGIQVLSRAPEVLTPDTETVPLQGLLNIVNPGPRQATQIKEIWDYLAPKASGVGDLLFQFRQIEHRLSPPRLGESRLSKIYNYVKLQNQISEAEKQRDSLSVH